MTTYTTSARLQHSVSAEGCLPALTELRMRRAAAVFTVFLIRATSQTGAAIAAAAGAASRHSLS